MRSKGLFAGLPFALVAVLTLLQPIARAAEEEEEAVRVFRTVSPSVVVIKNEEGGGTGFIIDANGTILTNAHVVTSPLPLSVEVDAGKPDAPGVIFKRARIVSVHPTLDLAIVRIDLNEHKVSLVPAKLAPTKAAPGQRVYAIGNPGSGGKTLDKTITSGMCSAINRDIEGVNYMQISAAINPGNSGGPVVDRMGRVVGVVTLKATDVEGVGFAIPIDLFVQKDFVAPMQRRSDKKQADEAIKMANRYIEMANQARARGGKDHPIVEALTWTAIQCYRHALMYDATNSTTYYNMGMTLRTVGEHNAAVAYIVHSIQMSPWSSAASGAGVEYRELGLALVQSKKNDQALVTYNEGLAKYPRMGKMWEDLAINNTHNQKWAAAFKCAAIALYINDRDAQIGKLNQLHADARGRIAGPELDKLENETSNEAMEKTLDQMESASRIARDGKKTWITTQFATLIKELGYGNSIAFDGGPIAATPTTPKVTTPITPSPKPTVPSPKPAIPKPTTPGVPVVAAGTPAPPPGAPVAVSEPRLPQPVTTIKLPGPFDRVRVGGGGRFLLFRIAGQPKLIVVDVTKAAIAKEIPLPEPNAIFTASATKLIIVAPGQKLIQRWNLVTLERENVTRTPTKDAVIEAEMGANSNGPLALWAGGAVTLLDLNTFRPILTTAEMLSADAAVPWRLRANAGGNVFLGYPSASPGAEADPGQRMTLDGNAVTLDPLPAADGSGLALSADGGLLLAGANRAFDGALAPLDAPHLKDAALVPSVDGRYFTAIQNGDNSATVSVCVAFDGKPIGSLAGVKDLPPLAEINADVPRALFVPSANMLLTLPAGDAEVRLQKLDLSALIAAGPAKLIIESRPPAQARLATPFKYQISARAKGGLVKYRLESGPTGMKVSPTGLVTWIAPITKPDAPIAAVIAITDYAGNEVFHSFELQVR